jgi:hypothetical protein
MHRLLGILFIVLGVAVTDAFAGPAIQIPTTQTCTGTNCGARLMSAVYLYDQFGNADPFILQVFAYANECLRIDVTAQDADLEAVVIAPNGWVYRNDDRSPGIDFRPLVRIASTPVRGWYTLQISKYNGVSPSANFTFYYGRYNGGNPNCSGATPAMAPDDAKQTKPDYEAPIHRAPGSSPTD